MNCKDFQDRISAAVDRCLDGQEMDQFEAHACCCDPCREEYENERSTKEFVQEHLRLVRAPADLRVSLLRRIDREAGLAGWTRSVAVSLWYAPAVRALLAFALTALVVALLIDRSPDSSVSPTQGVARSGADDVVRHTVDSYHGILRGEIIPQMGSGTPRELRKFFSGKTAFPVVLLRMKECAVVGGSVDEHRGAGLAHVLYRAGGDTIYCCQTSWESVQGGEVLQLSPEAKRSLLATGWYAPPPGEDAVVLWREGETLCIAVSHMGVDRLLASVKSGIGGGGDLP